MPTGKTAKKKAKIVQEMTGFGYDACLRLVQGDLRLTPRSPECVVERAFKRADAHPLSLVTPKPCTCAACDP